MFEVAWLLIAQVLGYLALLIPCLVCFLALVIWSATKEMAVPVLLFFLPFAALLKIQPGRTSFFTFALIIVYMICMVLGHRKINILHAIPGIIVIAMCLIVKTLYGYQIDNTYLLFSFSLLLAPYVATEFGRKYDFYYLTLFFTVGIAIATVSSLHLTAFPTIARYIENFNVSGVVRHAGYYGDPNFYSAHISAALAGVMVLLLNTSDKPKLFILVAMLIALTYCGFLAVSKMFFLVAICLFLLFILEFVFKKGKISVKLLLFSTFTIGALFLLSTTAFSGLLDMIILRFAGNSNLDDFTTGRTELWIQFIQAFKENPVLLMFGKGYTDVKLIARGSHNTAIQMIYQFGLLGCIFLVFWGVFCIRSYLSGAKISRRHFAQFFIIILGMLGPWLALDMLFFDEFFLMPMYTCIGISHTVKDDPLCDLDI